DFARPKRRPEMAETLFDRNESVDVDARCEAPETAGIGGGLYVREDADHFAGVPSQCADVEWLSADSSDRLVLCDAVPLHSVMLRNVPDERIAHGRRRRIAAARIAVRDTRHLVEDEANRVEAAKAVPARRCVHRLNVSLEGDQLRQRLPQ